MLKMKKNIKKVTALALASTMALSMAACGGGGEAKSDEAAKDMELTESGYPIVPEGEDLTLTCFTMSMPNVEDFATNDFTKYLEELTGIHIEFQTGGRDDWQDKLNMILASGDYPDIILGVSPDLAKYGVDEQIVIPLDDYLTEDIMPNYMAMYGDQLDQSREADGKIYSLLAENNCYHCEFGRKMWVNTEYLEEMGVEKPTTTQEFYDVCKKFMEWKPDGIAIAGTSIGEGWYGEFEYFLMGSFLLPPSVSYTLTKIHDKMNVTWDGEVKCIATDDRYKEFLKYCKSLYDIGAIYDGDFTQTSEQLKTIVNQADAPVLFLPAGTISDYIDSVSNPELYSKFETITPLEGPDGTRLTSDFKYSLASDGNFCITEACPNVEAALRWVDFFYSETGDLCSQYGADEGKDWVLNPEGKYGLNGEPALYEVLNPYSAEPQNHDWQDVGIRVAPEEYRLGQAVDQDVDLHSAEGLEKLLFQETQNNYEPYKPTPENSDLDMLPQLKVTSDELSEVSTIAVEVEKTINETSVRFITGQEDIDSGWDSYLDALDKAGLPTLLNMYQTAYDRQYGDSAE